MGEAGGWEDACLSPRAGSLGPRNRPFPCLTHLSSPLSPHARLLLLQEWNTLTVLGASPPTQPQTGTVTLYSNATPPGRSLPTPTPQPRGPAVSLLSVGLPVAERSREWSHAARVSALSAHSEVHPQVLCLNPPFLGCIVFPLWMAQEVSIDPATDGFLG